MNCNQITKKGTQCSRVRKISGLCAQHYNIIFIQARDDSENTILEVLIDDIKYKIYDLSGFKAQWTLMQVSKKFNANIMLFCTGFQFLWIKQLNYVLKTHKFCRFKQIHLPQPFRNVDPFDTKAQIGFSEPSTSYKCDQTHSNCNLLNITTNNVSYWSLDEQIEIECGKTNTLHQSVHYYKNWHICISRVYI